MGTSVKLNLPRDTCLETKQAKWKMDSADRPSYRNVMHSDSVLTVQQAGVVSVGKSVQGLQLCVLTVTIKQD